MNEKDKNKKAEPANSAETKKQNEDFRGLPAASEKTNPPDINKEDIKKSSEENTSGKTDNTK